VPFSIYLTCDSNFLNLKCINSIDRALLNEDLLDEACVSSDIRILFNHKVVAADFDRKFITIQDTTSGHTSRVDFDFLIGADGSYSVTRRQLMRVVRQVIHFVLQ
jgi:kynurenine 3-monooxygenase